MRLSWLLASPAVLSIASALAIEKRDADFLNVKTKMHKDMSGRAGDPKGKYFHESIFHPHYDGRFADHELGYRERKQALSNLIQTYLATMADIGVETWLMHGTLLGWWWNRKILPWDSDSDVQISEQSILYLASYYNMTVFHYKTPRIPDGRDYMLEINPYYVNREQTDKLNVIDARWVDTTSGLFIDITTARYNWTHPAGEGMMSCKDGHEYRDSYIFPLRDTFFEGTPAKIPFAYKEVLEAEYQKKALTQTEFEGHRFDDDKFEWIPVPKTIQNPLKTNNVTPKSKVDAAKDTAPNQGQKSPEGYKPEDKKAEEKKAEDKKAEEKKAEAKKAEDKKAEEKKAEEKKAGEKKAEDKKAEEKKAEEKKAGEKKAEEKKAEEKKAEEKKAGEKKAEEKKAEEKKAEEKKAEEPKVEKKADEKQAEEKKPTQANPQSENNKQPNLQNIVNLK